MKILFKKDEESKISVLQMIDGQEREFAYVDMINSLIESNKLDEPEISGAFTEAEVKSIRNMVQHINKKLASIVTHDSG